MEIGYFHANFVEGSVLTMDEFLYCYKPSEINQSNGFYQFTARGNDCRLIKSLASSDRNWKTEFIFVSGFWARNSIDVGKDHFIPYTGDLGNLRPEGTSLPFSLFFLFISFFVCTHNFYSLTVLQLLIIHL